MELLDFIFRMGVVFAIFGFIWTLVDIGLSLLRFGRPKTIVEEYLVKGVKYVLLTDVTFLFCLDIEHGNLTFYRLVTASAVLLTYFLGRIQKDQNRQVFFGRLRDIREQPLFDVKTESMLIAFSILLFIGFTFYPEVASNRLSLWFRSSIYTIENSVIIGWIFKLIGFFFLLGMIFKMINGIMYLLSGQPFIRTDTQFKVKKGNDEDPFDDYEEVD